MSAESKLKTNLPVNILNFYLLSRLLTSCLKSLPIGKSFLAAAAASGSKILFAGGKGFTMPENVLARVDIYDTVTQQWTTAELSEPRLAIAAIAVGTKIILAGGIKSVDPVAGTFESTSRVDIYDVSANSWSTTEMPKASYFEYDVPVAAANRAYFYPGDSSEIFVYDVPNNSWSTIYLPEQRIGMGISSNENQVIFFGGGFDVSKGVESKRVDVYHVMSNSWSIDSLSEARFHLKAASVSGKIVFAGGQKNMGAEFSDKIDIRDNTLLNWTFGQLTKAHVPVAAITSDERAVFIDGYQSQAEIYDASKNSRSTVQLYRRAQDPNPPPTVLVAVALGDKTYIAGTLPGDYLGVWLTRF